MWEGAQATQVRGGGGRLVKRGEVMEGARQSREAMRSARQRRELHRIYGSCFGGQQQLSGGQGKAS